MRPFFRLLLAVAMTAMAVACGSGPAAPPPAPIPTPPAAPVQTTVRVVSALGQQLGVPEVSLTVANGAVQLTDAAGMSVLLAAQPATVPLRLLHHAFLQRETGVRIPGAGPVDLSLIPATHDLAAFEEFAPRSTGLQRWTRNPRLLVLTHAVDFSSATLGFREYPVTDRRISPAQIDCLAGQVAATLSEMSGGHLTWESIDVADVQPGTRFRVDQTPEGTIAVLPSIALGAGGRGMGYLGSEPFILSRGAVWMSTDFPDYCRPLLLYRHELGHALGYQHVTRTASMMSPGLSQSLTDFDRNSIAILFQRRPGNLYPDRDQSGISVNVMSSTLRRAVEPPR